MRRLISQKNTFTAPIALAVLFALVFSQLFYIESSEHPGKKAKTEQNDGQEEELLVAQPSSSLPSSTHIELNQSLIFLFEIVFENKESEKRDFNVSLPPNRFFKTLFDGVISPNAP